MPCMHLLVKKKTEGYTGHWLMAIHSELTKVGNQGADKVRCALLDGRIASGRLTLPGNRPTTHVSQMICPAPL